MIWSTRFNSSFASSKYSFVAMDYFSCCVDELLCFSSEFLDLLERNGGGFVIFMANDELAIFAEFHRTFAVEEDEFLYLEHDFSHVFVDTVMRHGFKLEQIEFTFEG